MALSELAKKLLETSLARMNEIALDDDAMNGFVQIYATDELLYHLKDEVDNLLEGARLDARHHQFGKSWESIDVATQILRRLEWLHERDDWWMMKSQYWMEQTCRIVCGIERHFDRRRNA